MNIIPAQLFPLIEEWRMIPNIFDDIKPYYYISNYGRIYSSYNNIILEQQYNHSGYLQVGLMTNTGRIHRKVHRLVMISFLYFDECNTYQVNHRDGNKMNNFIYNLEWCTPKENIAHSINFGLRSTFIGESNPKAKISTDQAKYIGYLLMKKQYSDEEISNITNCKSIDIIRSIALGNTWNNLFSKEELENMLSTRKGHTIPIHIKNNICKYYEDNKYLYSGYGAVINMIKRLY